MTTRTRPRFFGVEIRGFVRAAVADDDFDIVEELRGELLREVLPGYFWLFATDLLLLDFCRLLIPMAFPLGRLIREISLKNPE